MHRPLLGVLVSLIVMLALPYCSMAQNGGQPLTICSGASIVIKGDAVSPTPSSYLWQLLQTGSWINAPGVNNGADYPPASLTNNTSASVIFSIRRKTITSGITNYDSNYDVTVLPGASITNNTITPPLVTTFCSPGNPAVIAGSTPAGGTGTFTYQWQSSTDNITFSNITGAASINYTPATLLVTTYYRRVIFGGSCVAPSVSNIVTITVFPNVSNNVITAPGASSFCTPTNPSVITGDTPSGGTGLFTYQWQSSTDSLTFTDIPGATAKDYDPPLLSVTTYYRRTAVSGICWVPVNSNIIGISILTAPVNNAITAPAVASFCLAGDPAVISGNTPSGGNGIYSYKWQSSTDNVSFTDIPGATAKDYDPPVISVTTYYRRTVVSGSCTTPIISSSVTISIVSPPTVPLAVQPVVTVCPGNPATLAVSSPQSGITYKWYDSAAKTNLLFTGSTYTTAAINVNTIFYVESSNGSCTSPSAAAVQVNLAPAPNTPVLTNNPVNTCSGTSATLSILNPQPGVTYNWYSSATAGSLIFTGTTYTTPVLTVSATYYVEAANGGGCASTRTAATVTVLPVLPPLAGNSITAPLVTSLCSAGDPANIVGNTPTGGNNTYNYQWQQSTDNVTFTDIAGATGRDYDPPVISVTTYYRRTASSGACTTPITSNVVTITIVTPPTTPLAAQPVVTVCPGNTATLSVNPQSGITYKWYDSAAKTNLLFTGATYTTGPVAASTTFYVESSNGLCTSPTTAAVQVNVTAAPTTPVLTTNPVNTCSGTSATLSIANPQPGVTYNWYPSATAGSLIFTGTTYATPVLTVNATYYVEAVNAGGCSSARTSANVTILPVLPPLAGNSVTAPAVTSFCLAGDPANIVGNTPTGGNNTYSYQWQQSTDNVTFTDIAGANTQSFDPPAITATTYYRRTASSGSCTTPLVSNVITMSILVPPTIPPTVQPTVLVCPGSAANLSVSAPQSGFIYNWYDSPAKTNLLYTGISYTTQPLVVNQAFYVESSNGLCSGSSTATVQVNMTTPPPAPLLVQDMVTICGGYTATFAISNPQAGFTYIWYSSATGGTPLNTGDTFTTSALSANTTYYVDETNAQGCTSISRAPAIASVIPMPQFTVQDMAVCPGESASLSANTSDPNITFAWFTTATGGSPVSTGNTLSIPVVSSNMSYYVEATNSLTGCVSASRQLAQALLLQPLPAPVAGVDSVTTYSVTFGWGAVSGAKSYLVSTDSGLSYTPPSSGNSGLSHTVLALRQNQIVTLVVKAIGSSGCQISGNSAAVTGQALNVTDDVYVPNAFTPNGDGKNDVVYVHSEGIKTINFYVYNQWGQVIFASVDKSIGWDGTFKGAKEPFGVYTYYVKAVMNNGHEVSKKGTITLLK